MKSIKLGKARKIIRKVERDLLQARIKSINNFSDNNNKQLDRCRSELASLVTTITMEECQSFINKEGNLDILKLEIDKSIRSID